MIKSWDNLSKLYGRFYATSEASKSLMKVLLSNNGTLPSYYIYDNPKSNLVHEENFMKLTYATIILNINNEFYY